MNTVTLVGELTFDTRLKKIKETPETPSRLVTNFTLASKDLDSFNASNSWVDCTAWDEMAEKVARYGKKGNVLAIRGSIINDEYIDAKGICRKTQRVHVSHVEIVSVVRETYFEEEA